MKEFINKVFIYVFYACVSLFIIYFCKVKLQDKSYDIKIYYNKVKYEQSLKSHCNTLFLGTSLTETGLIPTVFDSTIPNCKSFNLGLPGTPTIEFLKFSKLAIDNNHSVKNVLFEIRSPIHIRGYQYYERRNSIDLRDLKIITDIAKNQYKIPIYRRGVIFSSYVFSYCLNLLNFGMLSDYFKSNVLMYQFDKDGFYNPFSDADESIDFQFTPKEGLSYENNQLMYVNAVNELIQNCKKRNINITLWIPPNLPDWESRDIENFIKHIHTNSIIDGSENKEIQKHKIWLDKTHINQFGSKLNSKFISARYLEELKKFK